MRRLANYSGCVNLCNLCFSYRCSIKIYERLNVTVKYVSHVIDSPGRNEEWACDDSKEGTSNLREI